MSNLTKAIPVRLEKKQKKALDRLENKGFNRFKIIRIAINEYLINNYKDIMKDKIKIPF